MAGKFTSKEELTRLAEENSAARQCLDGEMRKMLHKLDVPSRIKSAVLNKPSQWFIGSLASGLLASMLLRKKRRPISSQTAKSAPRKFSSSLLALTLTAARPLVKVMVARLIEQQLRSKSHVRSAASDAAVRSSSTNHP